MLAFFAAGSCAHGYILPFDVPGARPLDTNEGSSVKLHSRQVGVFERSPVQNRVTQVCPSEIDVCEVLLSQVAAFENGIPQFRPLETYRVQALCIPEEPLPSGASPEHNPPTLSCRQHLNGHEKVCVHEIAMQSVQHTHAYRYD